MEIENLGVDSNGNVSAGQLGLNCGIRVRLTQC